jgi:WD repeat-containing protein 48
MAIIQVYLTDLMSRESLLMCSEDSPILSLALQGEDWLWVATSDSSIHKWPTEESNSVKILSKANSFVAGALPFARARACLESSPPVSILYHKLYFVGLHSPDNVG